MSIFLWRLLHNRIPVDTKLQWRNMQLASKCRCCRSSQIETRLHLFIHGDAARRAWNHFAAWFPGHKQANFDDEEIPNRLRAWCRGRRGVMNRHICFIIPCLIMWFIWSERNNCVHRDSPFRPYHVIWLVKLQLRRLQSAGILRPEDWYGCSPQVTWLNPHIRRIKVSRSIQISWRPPDPGWIKVNTDGAFSTSLNKAGGGGLIRSADGNIIKAFSSPLLASSCFEAEILALEKGVVLAKELGSRLWLEVDATALVNTIATGEPGPARLRHSIRKISCMLRGSVFKISHVPREGNKAADHLAGIGLTEQSEKTYDGSSTPARVKAFAAMDRLGLPNFRIRSKWTYPP